MARFGLFLHASDRQTEPARLFDELAEEAALAEEVGFEACLIAEHHQSPNGHYPAPLMLAAGIGARTRTIRIGTSVLLAPLYHPMHLAEESATADLISGGRLILGMGIGYTARDFDPFGISLKERASRMEDHLRFLKRAWTEDNVTYHGKHFRFDNVTLAPKPVQRPRPPIWLGGDVPAALRRAARHGDAWVGFPFHGLETVTERTRFYRQEAEAFGRRPMVALRRDGWVAEDRELAMRQYEPAVRSFQRFMQELHSHDEWFRELTASDAEREAGNRLLLGTPEECIATARRYAEEAGVDWFIMRFRQPDGPPHEEVMKAIELFGREVIPALRSGDPALPLVADR